MAPSTTSAARVSRGSPLKLRRGLKRSRRDDRERRPEIAEGTRPARREDDSLPCPERCAETERSFTGAEGATGRAVAAVGETLRTGAGEAED